MALSALMGGVGSFKRIQEFFAIEVRGERRKFPAVNASIASSMSIDTDSDKKSEASQKERDSLELSEMKPSGSQAIVIENGLFGWDKDQPSGTLHSINMIVPRMLHVPTPVDLATDK